ncbi:MAG: hypothetical protein H7Y07_04765 [Pyrinomonadaceae bacterium]|nr:hypothetical protein [Sphingobacteriaceae bacterium]
MKSILLKLDDKLFEETELSAKEEKASRSTYIKRALETYNTYLKNKKLKTQLENESLIIREESMKINEEISEGYSNDFIKDDY